MDTGRWKRQVLLFTIMVFLASGIFPIPVSAEKKVIRVGYMDFQNFIYEEPDGTYSGYGVEYLEKIANYTDWEYEYVFDRSQRREKRPKKEIGISAVRGGTIVGDHDVILAGTDEVITFSHTAYSKAVFGKGAVQAAKFLNGKPAGRYQMSDVIDEA